MVSHRTPAGWLHASPLFFSPGFSARRLSIGGHAYGQPHSDDQQ
jgi:hypothetical protein